MFSIHDNDFGKRALSLQWTQDKHKTGVKFIPVMLKKRK